MFRAIDILKNLNSIGHNTTPVTGRPQCNRGFPDITENVKKMSNGVPGTSISDPPENVKKNVEMTFWGISGKTPVRLGSAHYGTTQRQEKTGLSHVGLDTEALVDCILHSSATVQVSTTQNVVRSSHRA